MTIDGKTLNALRKAASFVLTNADDIDYNNEFAARHMRVEHPNATADAENETWQNADRVRKELDDVLAALKAAGITD